MPAVIGTNPLRKLASIARILRQPYPGTVLRQRWRYNLLAMRLALSRRGFFTYLANTGTTFIVDSADPATFFIFTSGHPDTAELGLIQRWLQPGDCCLDVGANIGFFTSVMAACVGSAGRVLSFEPGPRTHATLQRTVRRLGLAQVTTIPTCAGAAPGSVVFFAARDPNHSSVQALAVQPELRSQFESVTLPVTRADDSAAEHIPGRAVALVKIDVEGSEPDVLAGCTRLLAAADPPIFVVEINVPALALRGNSPATVLRQFDSRFEFLFITATPSAPTRSPVNRLAPLTDRITAAFPPLGNLIAVPRVGVFAGRRDLLGTLADAP